MNSLIKSLWVPVSFLGMFLAVVFLRPLLPIDETRYVSVAWEMFLRGDWLAPLTMNGTPYHHKPPLLFWLINALWAITGPSRWSATIPPFLSGMAVVLLTAKLALTLYKDRIFAERALLIMMGSMAFLVYSSMVMFDVTLAVFVLGTLITLIRFSESPRWYYIPFMGLLLGLGVLTKGPVAYLYIIFPMVLGPLWHKQTIRPLLWYGSCLLSIILSVIPVMLWLVPVLQQSDNHFAFWLVWEQTAGRITGNFNDAHVRPFWFYLPIVPLLLMPWIFFPHFWRNARAIRLDKNLSFLLCWIVPVFISFSIISGKQPHYLVPLVPGMAILTAWLLRDRPLPVLQRMTGAVIGLFVLAHIAGCPTFLKNYDLAPVAAYVREHADSDWAFVKKYHGELTFLARMKKPMDVLEGQGNLPAWFESHPDGLAVMRYKNPDAIAGYKEIFSVPYRGKTLGILASQTSKP